MITGSPHSKYKVRIFTTGSLFSITGIQGIPETHQGSSTTGSGFKTTGRSDIQSTPKTEELPVVDSALSLMKAKNKKISDFLYNF